MKRFRDQLAEGEASDRSFGVVLVIGFTVVGILPQLRHGPIRVWALMLAAALLLITLAVPTILRGPKRAWLFLGFLLGLVVSPIVLGILFYLVVTPFGMLMRLAGRDRLRLRNDKAASSYWRLRTEAASDMTEQF